VLGLKPLVKCGRGSESGGAYFLVGDLPAESWFCLNVDPKRTPAPCYTHYAFSVSVDNFDAMSKRIVESGANVFDAMSKRIVESGANVFKDNISPGDSLYFEDPDGHKLELHVCNWHDRITFKKKMLGNGTMCNINQAIKKVSLLILWRVLYNLVGYRCLEISGSMLRL
jgi:predicted enzyme related to lactoylglutathione lyase